MPLSSAETELIRSAAKDEACRAQLIDLYEQMSSRIATLEATNRNFRQMAHHFPDGALYLVDKGFRYLLADGQKLQPGLTTELLEGKSISEVFPPEVVEMVKPYYGAALAGSMLTREMWLEDQLYQVRYVPIRGEDGAVHAAMAVVQDVTELKKIQEALADSETRTRSVLSALAEGVMLQDRSGAIIYCNAAAERMLGLSRDQMTGKMSLDSRWQTVHEDGSDFPAELHPAMIALHTGRPQRNVVMGVHKPDEELTWISVNSQPIYHPDETTPYGVVASFVDITARKKAERDGLELALERKRAELLGHFIQTASHEFRTPLSIIKTSLFLLNKTQDSEQRLRKATIISDQVNRIDRLVDMLVEQLIIDSGVPFQRVNADLNGLVRSCVDDLQASATKRGITLSHDLSADLPRVQGDPERLIEALGHVVENAIAFTLDGGSVWLRTSRLDQQAVIEVRDTGLGIDPSDLPRIFERFYRRDHAHTTPGFGLGLSIADEIVERHRGKIEVESTAGEGSMFRILLPL